MTTIQTHIGIIGGNGWLGNAIASALIRSGTVQGQQVILSGRSEKRGDLPVPGAVITRDNHALVAQSGVVVLCVPPADFPALDVDLKDRLVISVMAGVSTKAIAERLGGVQIVRAIPNAAAAIGQSFTPWFAVPAVSAAHKALVQTLFEACGSAAEVPLEAHIDYCVGMTGSGAAFPALLAEAMIEHAVSQGLPYDFAQQAAKGVLTGASQLFAGKDADTAAIVKAMIDYQGTTAAALIAMQEQGFNQAVALGLEAAAQKASQLG